MSITCQHAKRSSSAYVDGRLRSGQHLDVAAHLAECEACNSYFEQVVLIRTALGALPQPVIPQHLRTSLRVIASKEQASLVKSHGSRLQAIWDKWRFRLHELMRPLALPATGGLISSLLLFGTFILTIGTTTRIATYEIPLADESGFEADLVPVELRSQLVVLNMSFDRNGRIADYNVADPARRFNAGLRAHPASITVPEFSTVFGVAQPISGDIEIKLVPLAFRQ